jgi:predicted permease
MMLALASELRQTRRRLVGAPAYAALTIGILAAGMATNAAMLALVDAILLRDPFHVATPERVVRVRFQAERELSPGGRTHYAALVDLRRSGAFEAVAAHAEAAVSVGAGRNAMLTNALLVSQDFFDVLRPQPFLGSFSTSGRVADSGEWVIASYGFWQRHLGADRNAIGRTITIDGVVRTVVAVTPNGFSNLAAKQIDLWLPLSHVPFATTVPARWRENRDRAWLYVAARLHADGSRTLAEQRATALLRNRSLEAKDRKALVAVTTASLVGGRDGQTPLETKVSFWLMALSAIVLVIACSNVANLVLARVIAHRRELLVRRALGAGTGYFLYRALLESCAIVGPAVLTALVVSSVLRKGIVDFLPHDVPLSTSMWDARTAGLVISSGLVTFALVFLVSLSGIGAALKARDSLTAGPPAGRIRTGGRRALLAAQAGLSLVLLFVAVAFVLSLRRAESLDLGADVDRTVQVTLTLAPYQRAPGIPEALYRRGLEHLRQLPGVERVALAAGSPFMSGRGVSPRTADRTVQELWPARSEVAYSSIVGADFFSTVGATVRGRDFHESDHRDAEPVAIVNQPLARYLWPSGNAIGQCMWFDAAPACVKVVGVLSGVWKFNALERDKMAVYLPLAQVPDEVPGAIYVRARTDAERLLPDVVATVQNMGADLPAARATLLRTVVESDFRPWRLGATVFSAFAAVAVVLTSIGLYGVVAAAIELRKKEIGIRVALGARASHVIWTIVGEGLLAVAVGFVSGMILLIAAGPWLAAVLFETSPYDTSALSATVGILLAVAVLAAAAPLSRALGVKPMDVLRVE